jgi:integrase/recombinase XerC
MVRSLALETAVELFCEDLSARQLSPRTLKAYRADLAAVIRLLPRRGDGWRTADLTGSALQRAFARLAADHAPASLARARSTWSTFLDVLVRDGYLAGNPIAAVPRTKTPAKPPKPLAGWDTDTLERLAGFVLGPGRRGRDVWPELDRVVVALLLGTGLRAGELLGLNLGSCDTTAGDANLRVGRGDKRRSVPLPQPLPDHLDAYLASRRGRFPRWAPSPRHPLLVGPPRPNLTPAQQRSGGRRLTSNQLDYLLKQVLDQAGLGNRRPAGANAHAYRHTFATLLASQGTPLSELQGLMGHVSSATTQGYLRPAASDRHLAAAANPALRHLRTRAPRRH